MNQAPHGLNQHARASDDHAGLTVSFLFE